MDLSVIIPAKNEAANLPALLQEINQALAGHAFEVLVIDDGSSDHSWALLAELKGQFPWLRALRLAQSSGQSTAVWLGCQKARGRFVATLDGDGQNDPADIPKLLTLARRVQGPACVCGIRTRRNDSWLKRVSSKVANGVRRRLLNDGVVDTGCGLKLLGRDLFLSLPYFDHMHRFLPALCVRVGATVLSEPVNHRPRTAGTSKYGLHNRLWVGLVDMAGVRWLQKRAKQPQLQEELP
ncbi:glycosyltransferase family 2 protein [Gallaecimonas xiamenensis]|uniref:Glycosyl transferase family protein n=1 Tax=Gallaecimonas xiamenensis 3-C-1 TaxID=745411 RepID=K2JKL1_9GAMM|nr:glycosyltransferase family 2 protein [Gallaecimonas xiamenensis]EKE75863.1 glycosyl transferase family protein [Gallaecimonas xiamenensis 3-C-1]